LEPRVFIGSTKEDQRLAVALQSLLEDSAAVAVWDQGVFEPNKSNLENLFKAARTSDFACIFATPSDVVVSRGKEFFSPRDNIIFEFGLFLGAFGPDRVFLLHQRTSDLKLPSDLAGITLLDFKPVDQKRDEIDALTAVLARSAEIINGRIRKLGQRLSKHSRRYTKVLERGSIDQISNLADASLHFPRRRFGYREDIREYIYKKEVIPARYYYVTDEGAEFWIKMSSDPLYKFHSNSIKLIRRFSKIFANHVDVPFDFISLGSGDGVKDQILLDASVRKSKSSEGKRTGGDICYYPIDISDKLLVECLKNVFRGSLLGSAVKMRAILGDFCDLSLLKAIYEDRPAQNVFSILGNTFGNTDETYIMNALQDAMYSGDYLLVEVNCAVNEVVEDRAFIRSDFVREYCSLPLNIIGLQTDVDKVEVNKRDKLSGFRAAQSVEVTYKEIILAGAQFRNVPLEYDHRYNFGMLREEIEVNLDVEVIAFDAVGSAGILLARKR